MNDYDLDREPTIAERLLGIILSFILNIAVGFAAIGGTILIYKKGDIGSEIFILIILYMLFALTLYLFYRAVFTKSEKPSPKSTSFINYIKSIAAMLAPFLVFGFIISIILKYYFNIDWVLDLFLVFL